MTETAHDREPLSVSAGVAGLDSSPLSAGELLLHADRALYAAKKAGRDRTARFSGDVEVGPPRHGAAQPLAA